MPTYDYRCPKCEKAFEKLVPLAQRDEVTCPECGTKPAVRLLTGGRFMTGQGCSTKSDCSPSGCGSGFS